MEVQMQESKKPVKEVQMQESKILGKWFYLS